MTWLRAQRARPPFWLQINLQQTLADARLRVTLEWKIAAHDKIVLRFPGVSNFNERDYGSEAIVTIFRLTNQNLFAISKGKVI